MKTAWYVTLILLTLTGLLLLWQFSIAVVIFMLSLALAAAFRPLIEDLNRIGLPQGVALITAYGLTLLVIIGVILLASSPLVTDLQNISNDALRGYEEIKNTWVQEETGLLSNFAKQLPSSQEIYSSLTGDASVQALQTILGVAEGTFSFLAQLALVLVLSLYWSAGQVRFERLWLSLLPVEWRARARTIWQAVEDGVGQYIRREVTFSLISGVLLWIGYFALGVNYPALLALLGVIARLIPWLGPFLVIFLPLLFGSYYGLWASLAAVVFTFLILVVLEVTIGNQIFPRRSYSSILLVIILIALALSFGLTGIILGTILTVALQILFSYLIPTYGASTEGKPEKTLESILAQLDSINKSIGELQENNASETLNLASRLNELVNKIPEENQQPQLKG